MSSIPTVLSEIFGLTRGDLENAEFPFPNPTESLKAFTWGRLARLTTFWKRRDSEDDPAQLEQATEDLVTGLYWQGCPWAFALRGTASRIHSWVGIQRQGVEASFLNSLIAGAFPDARIVVSDELPLDELDGLRFAQILTGTPSRKRTRGQGFRADQIEKLCRGLGGQNWLFLVQADPVPGVVTVRGINELTLRVRDAHASFLLKNSPIDEQDRTAQRLVELLEAKLKRLEQGRVSGMWNVRCHLLTDSPDLFARGQHLLQASFSGDDSVPDPIRIRPCSPQVHQTPLLEPLTSTEVALLTRPPTEDYPGYELVEYARFGVEPSLESKAVTISVGEILDRGKTTGNLLSIRRDDLTKHGLVAGMTGSGKTNTCFSLLDQIWDRGLGIPFLVIESAKSEYRRLLKSPRFVGLRVFTAGDDTISPLRLNPFDVPPGILVQTHIDYIKSLFSAAFVLYPPMPYVLEQSIQELYEDRGWNIALNVNSRGQESNRVYPTLSDLAAKISVVVDRMGYDERITMDVKAGLLARIDQLRLAGGKGRMLNHRSSTPASLLFEGPCVLELKQIVSDDEKAFLIGLLLIRLFEHHEARLERDGRLVHVTLIEEAHRLLRNVSTEQGNEVVANPRGRAIEVFANILSEIRAFGEGILLAEQIPTKLAPDAVKNTGLKVIHRLVSKDDRELMGNAVNLDEAQMRYLATLTTGEAVAWTESSRKAVLVRVPVSPAKVGPDDVSPDTVRQQMQALSRTELSANLPFRACRECRAALPGRSCSSRVAERAGSVLLDSWRRLWNALRLSPASALMAFEEFCHIAHRSLPREPAPEVYCLFAELAELDLERRGEFRGWRYADVEEAIDLACSIVREIAGSPTGLTSTADAQVVSLGTLAKRLDTIEALPYPGCSHCPTPCAYRFDMSQASRVHGKEFRSAFLNPKVKVNELVRVCRGAAASCYTPQDRSVLEGASLCFAVQQYSQPELGLSLQYQSKLTAMLYTHLPALR